MQARPQLLSRPFLYSGKALFVHFDAISFRKAIPFGTAEFWHKFLDNNNFVIDSEPRFVMDSESRRNQL